MSRITSAPPRLVVDACDEVLVAVADGDVGAQLAAQVEFRGGSGGDRHRGAERVGHLDGVRADAAGAAVDEQCLARREVCCQDQVGPHRAGHLGQPGRVEQADPGRNRHDLPGRNGDVFGVAAARQQSADFLPELPLRASFAHRRHRAGDLHAEDLAGARRRWVAAGGLQQIGAVEAGCGDLDQDFARIRRDVGDFPPRELIGSVRQRWRAWLHATS